MGMSLRDQLIQAGLATEKQARAAQAPQRPRQQSKQQRAAIPEKTLADREQQAQKAARDQELNRKQQEKADRRARFAQIRQLVEQNGLPLIESDEHYNFVDGKRIKRIAVNPLLREQLNRGELVVVRCDSRYQLVPAAIGARIAEREASVVMKAGAQVLSSQPVAAPEAEDPYAQYKVPDELMW